MRKILLDLFNVISFDDHMKVYNHLAKRYKDEYYQAERNRERFGKLRKIALDYAAKYNDLETSLSIDKLAQEFER